MPLLKSLQGQTTELGHYEELKRCRPELNYLRLFLVLLKTVHCLLLCLIEQAHDYQNFLSVLLGAREVAQWVRMLAV